MTSLRPVFKRLQPLCGTWLELSVSSNDREVADGSMTAAFETARRLESIFNFFDPSSELSRLNRAEVDAWTQVTPELAEVLHFGAELEARSKSAFRLQPGCPHGRSADFSEWGVQRRCNCPFDLGGIAKGYIVDQVFLELERRHPGERIRVNAGGDLRTSHPDKVELRIPADEGEVRYEVTIERGAVATSARLKTAHGGVQTACYPSIDYETSGPMSATVFAESCFLADAMTKVALFGDLNVPAFSDFAVGNVLCFTALGTAI